MKKLSIVYHYFAHYREPVLRELCQRLSANYEIELLADERAEIPALKTIRLEDFCKGLCGFKRLKNVWFGAWLWQVGLLSSVFRNKSDVIIFLGQFNFLSTWPSVLLARLMGKQTFFWSHGVYGNEGMLKRFIRVTFYRLAHGMLLYGHYSKGLLVQCGMAADRMHVIYNSLNYREQRELRELKSESLVSDIRSKLFGQSQSTTPYLIFVGRLTSIKRLDLLVQAVARLKELGRCVNCLIVGEGPEEARLHDLVRAENLGGHLLFYGPCHQEQELSELIYAADICVAPGNVGLTAMHALVYGTPVVTHADRSWQMPEFEAIVSNVNGDFFERDNPDDLVKKIIKLLRLNLQDRAAMRERCYKIIDEKYNPENQARAIQSVIG